MKIVVNLDMDGPLFDFNGGVGRWPFEHDPPEMFKTGFYRNLKLTPGAKEAVEWLQSQPWIELRIGSKPTLKTPYCAGEKLEAIEEHFPKLLSHTGIVTDKCMLTGHYLIDDDMKWRGKFPGVFLWFDQLQPQRAWSKLLQHFVCVGELYNGYT
jgi:hypothetical protein